jgi:hypothetical protein
MEFCAATLRTLVVWMRRRRVTLPRAQRELHAAGVGKSDAKKKPEILREEAGDLSDLRRDLRHWFVECG